MDVVLEPNPARGRVGVKSTVGMTGLSVYNVQGALVERQEARGMQAWRTVRRSQEGRFSPPVYS